jgi:queuine tRNA-ribosyltransferase
LLHLARGDVRTPAFVPLATKAAVKGLEPREVAALGYEMVLANTFHLFLAPGHELVAELGGVHEFMRWERPVMTDSGGFQVFSMGHGTVADEIKGRRAVGDDQPDDSRAAQPDDSSAARSGEAGSRGRGKLEGEAGRREQDDSGAPRSGEAGRRAGGKPEGKREGKILAIEEDGVRFRSYVDGTERFLGPEISMAVQAALGSDIALVLDECTPFHATREYTAHSTERTHRWLARCLCWHAEHGPENQAVYGIVQGGVYEDLRRESTSVVAESGCDGVAIGGSLGNHKDQMYEVVSWTTAVLEERAPDRPRHLLGIGEVDDLITGVELGIDTFDCAMPTRLGRHGVALVADPAARWRLDLAKSAHKRVREPIEHGCPCPACAQGFSRAYLHYTIRAKELTAARLITLHNLTFIARLMRDLRDAIVEGRLEEVATALRAGSTPKS